MATSALASAYAGLLTANNQVVSKRMPQRSPPRGRSRFLLASAQELPDLLHRGNDEGYEIRLARITAAAMAKSSEPRQVSAYQVENGLARELVTRVERVRLKDVQARMREVPGGSDQEGRICRYCTLFGELFYDFSRPNVVVVGHAARIQTDFDLASAVSKASIDDYQLLLPEALAADAIDAAHPLFWDRSAPKFFDEVAPATAIGSKPHEGWRCDSARKTNRGVDDWESSAAKNGEYLYERAAWPVNEQSSARVENVLRIDPFIDATVDAGALGRELGTALAENTSPVPITPLLARVILESGNTQLTPSPLLTGKRPAPKLHTDRARILHFHYALESCVRSNYNIGWEDFNGLNLDDGAVTNVALHYSQITPQMVAHLSEDDLRDLLEVLRRHALWEPGPAALAQTIEKLTQLIGAHAKSREAGEKARLSCAFIKVLAPALAECWQEEVYFLTISSSKRLRFSLPLSGAVESWSALTWAAPAMLFTFMNRAVCQLPHLLQKHPDAFAGRA